MARIAGVDLPRDKRIEIGLTYICLLYTSNLRFQHAVNQLDNPMRLKAVKKEIAVVKTIMRENELKAQA